MAEEIKWIKNKHGVVYAVPRDVFYSLMQDRNRGYEEADEEFVPNKFVRPADDGKAESNKKFTTTPKTYREFEPTLNASYTDLKELAVKNNLDVSGVRSKKAMLELLEEKGLLF
jgi:hypothetical protein